MDELKGGWLFRELSFLFFLFFFFFRGMGTRLGETLPSHVILEEVFLGGTGSSQEEKPPASKVLSQPLAQ